MDDMEDLINRRTREPSREKIASTHYSWCNSGGKYGDMTGFCNPASVEKVRELDYKLTPGRYVGLPDQGDAFGGRLTNPRAELETRLRGAKVNGRALEKIPKEEKE
jgi:type I restriction enzyme M protein